MQNIDFNTNTFSVINSKKSNCYTYKEIQNIFKIGEMLLKTQSDKVLAELLSAIYPRSVQVTNKSIKIAKDFEFNQENFVNSLKILQRRLLSFYKCPVKNISIRKDGSCSSFISCILTNNHNKPKGCIAENKIEKIPKKDIESLISSLSLDSFRNISKEIYSLIEEALNCQNNEEIVISSSFRGHMKITKKITTITKQVTVEETNIKPTETENEENKTFYEYDDQLIEIIRLLPNISEELDKITSNEPINNSEHVCPYIIRGSAFSPIKDDMLLQAGGTCTILTRLCRPFMVNARISYIFTPKRRVDCYYNFTRDKYPKCWVFNDFAPESIKNKAAREDEEI